MLDVDHFKRFNDRYGHQAGDDCLRAVARAVQAALRRAADMLARYGGEELVIMLPNTDIAGARAVARAALDAVSQLHLPHAASPVTDYVTVSIGVADVVPERGSVPATLINAADQALYAAKAAGRNRING
jgi:diguanylate cyclase (GGDEF)-like protein